MPNTDYQIIHHDYEIDDAKVNLQRVEANGAELQNEAHKTSANPTDKDYQSIYRGSEMDERWGKAATAIQNVSVNGTDAQKDSDNKVYIEIPTKVSELENDTDFIGDAPSDNEIYGRKNNRWEETAYKEDVEWGDF